MGRLNAILNGLAKRHFNAGEYSKALAHFQKASHLEPLADSDRLKAGICEYYLNNIDEALTHFEYLYELKKEPSKDLLEYRALSYHHALKFDKAIAGYKALLSQLGSNDLKRKAIIDKIKRAASGLQYQYQDAKGIVENLGAPINTVNNETSVKVSPTNFSKIYFSSSPNQKSIATEGKLKIYSSSKESIAWEKPELLSSHINSAPINKVLDFYPEGSAVIYFIGYSEYAGEILVDTFKSDKANTLKNYPWHSPLVSEQGDVSLDFVGDTVIIFSSRRKGGFGGLDLYVSKRSEYGWMDPINLGPDINSPYDESAPHLLNDGMTLFFSSNRTESIGGYDIFRSTFRKGDMEWGQPENLGLPINSSADDLDFSYVPGELKGYFCSDRKSAIGGFDIYTVYFTNDTISASKRANGFH